MTSILYLKSKLTFIFFYLIVPKDFENKNINFLEILHKENDYFNIILIIIDNRYDNANTDRKITKQTYISFSLGEVLFNAIKTIYFDTDIIVYKDLIKFFNINFNVKLILDYFRYENKRAEIGYLYRINTGVLLMNLLELRKNKFEKYFKLLKKDLFIIS